MVVELGPLESAEVNAWVKFARRIMCELRLDPSDLGGIATGDILQRWSQIVDQWSREASGATTFRWSAEFDAEQAEYLLHGFERCVGSDVVRRTSTAKELRDHQPFSMHVIQGFVDALSAEGSSCQQYVDQVRGSVGRRLDH